MYQPDMEIVTQLPRKVREIENAWIPLKDGTHCAARIWLPEDAEEKPVPAILEFLPYRKRDGTVERDELTHPYYAGHGYACVRVDIRGSGDSEGILEDEYLEQEQLDGVEILDWIAKQPWCTGKTGMIGISWGGFNGLQIAARRPESLKAIVTIASTDDRYADDIHYMGGVMINDTMSWGATMFAFNTRPPDPALVGERWRELWMERLEANDPWVLEWLKHQRRDEFWQQGSVCENYADIECAVYAVGGWHDGYSNAVPRMLANLDCPRKGLVGPWAHKYPHFAKPGPRIGFLQETLRWWDHWLKDEPNDIMDEPMYRAWIFDPVPPRTYYGERPGRWVAEPAWPSDGIEARRLHLNEGGRLGDQPADETAIAFRSPLVMGMRQGEWCSYGSGPAEPADQRADDGCSVVFETAPLDEAIEILGAPAVELEVSADRPDALVAVRLSDVAPDGAATRVSYGLLNLTHRDSHESPEPLEPGKRYRVRVQMNDVGQRFEPGHRIRVAISSNLFPLAWPSPEPVTLTLATGVSALELPVRAPREEDDALRPFPGPECSEPWRVTELEPGRHERRIEIDEVTREHAQIVVNEGGMLRLDDIGVEDGATTRQRFSIREDDPTSARIEIEWETRFRRPDHGVETRAVTRSVLSCTADSFIVEADCEAFEGTRRVFSRTWNHSFPRDLN